MRPPSCDLQGDGCEPARRRAAEHATGARLEDGAMARALEASAHGGPDDGAAEVRTAALEGDERLRVDANGERVGAVRRDDAARLADRERVREDDVARCALGGGTPRPPFAGEGSAGSPPGPPEEAPAAAQPPARRGRR